ncbi:Zn-dependent exopeptidase M28 [Candidatus Poribacteria bacterium]|nr:Zn-dependent exopeptidase M28 [Candidatus Poribacteria bacterium]
MLQIKHFTVACLFVLFTIITVSADKGAELIEMVQTESLMSYVSDLQENTLYHTDEQRFRTRNIHHHKATDNVVNYITTKFQSIRRLEVYEQNDGGVKNVIAVLPPKEKLSSKRVFIICAHYDSTAHREPNWNPLVSSAPGANKNGTGVAAMLEIANILSQYEYDHEIKFIALGGEEIGFLGSRNYIQTAVNNKQSLSSNLSRKRTPESEKITAVFNLDMIGFNWKSDLVEIIANRESVWISRALTISNTWHNIGLKIRRTQDEIIDIASHKPFWESGYSAVTLIESSTPWRDSQNYDANPFYHTFNDTVDKINFRLVTKVTQLVLVTVDSLLTDMFNTEREIPKITLELPQSVKQNPLNISGTFSTNYPIDIVVHPSNIEANIDRENQTYNANIPLSPGNNTLMVVAQYPLGAVSIKRNVVLEEGFIWKDVIISPNPVRFNARTEFRVEGNLEITGMHVNVYDAHGSLIQRIEGVDDRLNKRIWRTWWNQQTVYGLAVSAGIYICYISVVSKGETYTIIKKLAIMR